MFWQFIRILTLTFLSYTIISLVMCSIDQLRSLYSVFLYSIISNVAYVELYQLNYISSIVSLQLYHVELYRLNYISWIISVELYQLNYITLNYISWIISRFSNHMFLTYLNFRLTKMYLTQHLHSGWSSYTVSHFLIGAEKTQIQVSKDNQLYLQVI